MAVACVLTELHYLPSIRYMRLLASYPVVVLDQQEHYQKGSYRNRAHIAGANGLLRLSIPLRKGKHQQMPIREVEIAYDEDWQRLHWQTLQSAYGKAPFFEHYAPELEPLFLQPLPFLFDWNLQCLKLLIDLLGLDADLQTSSQYYTALPEGWTDARNHIHPKAHRQEGPPQDAAPTYMQVFQDKNGFIPDLSVLDLLFCLGPQAVLYLG